MRHFLFIVALVLSWPATAAGQPAKIVSLNVCTDQLLLALADPDQIAGVSRFALSREISFLADEARKYPVLRGGAEDVLIADPDLVLAGTFTSRATRDLLKRAGYAVEAVSPVRSIAEGKAQIARVAALLGHPERGAALIADIEAAETEARAGRQLGLSAVYYQRRGFVSGAESLMSDLFATVGLANAADRYGLMRTGSVRLEGIVADPPDILVVSDPAPEARDQGTALILHPALADAVAPERRIAVAERLTICGGPSLAGAIRAIADEAARIAAE